MSKKKLILLMSLMVVPLIVLAGCLSSAPATPTAAQPTLLDRVSRLETEYSQLEGRVGASSAADIQNIKSNLQARTDEINTIKTKLGDVDVAALQREVVALQANIAALNARVVELEKGTPSATIGVTTRWSLEVFFEDVYPNVCLDWSVRPTRIEEEDTYTLTVNILNSSTNNTSISKGVLDIVLTPADKTTSIDTSNTFLEATKAPYVDWTSDFRPKPVSPSKASVGCRRITFTSDEFSFTIPPMVGDVCGAYTLKLSLDLTYVK